MATTFRYTRVPGDDNSALLISREHQTPAYAATLGFTTSADITKLWLSLTGACTLNHTNTAKTANKGDELTIILTPDLSADRTLTFGTGFAGLSATTLVCDSDNSSSWTGVFDGTNWIETGRSAGA